jgi:shikimate dehydrogenase
VNCTIPHKADALRLVHEADDHARRIGVVNTVAVEGDQLIGFNTDGPGLARAVRAEFGVDLRDMRVLILGAGGGAGRAIAMQCGIEGCERLVLVNRTLEKGQALAAELGPMFASTRVLGPVARLEAIPWEESSLRFQLENSDLVINCTSVGLKRTDASPLSSAVLQPHLMIYDTIYTARRTRLMQAADEAGARSANGLSMLLHQGALAFEIWFNRPAPLAEMRRALEQATPIDFDHRATRHLCAVMTLPIAFVLGLLIVAIILFATEKLSVDIITFILLIALVASGTLTPKEAFVGFSEEIIIILGAIFVISGALQETGVLDLLGARILKLSGTNPNRLLLLLMATSSGVSGFMNNTTVTAMLQPPVIGLARRANLDVSKLLMPLAFASILGGTCTLIGTSTNVAVSGYMKRSGMQELGLFEITPLGLILVTVGITYMMLIGKRMLPENREASLTVNYVMREYLSEIIVLPNSPLIGQRSYDPT